MFVCARFVVRGWIRCFGPLLLAILVFTGSEVMAKDNPKNGKNTHSQVAPKSQGAKKNKSKGKTKNKGKGKGKGGSSANRGEPNGIYVRIIPFGLASKMEWSLKGHNGQDILNMIRELKPNVLNRFTTGKPKTGLQVPMGGGRTMSFTQFLTAAMGAGAPGCYLTPKIHLNNIWSDSYRMQAAKELRQLPVTPRLQAVDLDCYFSGGGTEAHRKALKQFKEMGWQKLGFNYAGQIPSVFGMGNYGLAAVSRGTWKVNADALKKMKRQGIKTPLVHIDYPRAIEQFGKLAPDRQADIILKQIAPQQKKLGFRFVYPILYSGYDSTKQITKKNGKYHGATLYDLMKRQIAKDRA